MNTEVKKALKWIARSGVMTVFLTGLLSLTQSLQTGKIDLTFFGYSLLTLVISSTINVLDYYRHENAKSGTQ